MSKIMVEECVMADEGYRIVEKVEEGIIELLSWLEEYKRKPEMRKKLVNVVLEEIKACETQQQQLRVYLEEKALQWNGEG